MTSARASKTADTRPTDDCVSQLDAQEWYFSLWQLRTVFVRFDAVKNRDQRHLVSCHNCAVQAKNLVRVKQ